MKKLVLLLVFIWFNTTCFASNMTTFNIIDNECVVFIQGSNINSSINAPLEIFLNTVTKSNLQVWYIKKDQYSRIKFNNNTYCELKSYSDTSNEVLLYKKGRSYYKIDLLDENISSKVNTYFGRKIYPIFDKRSKEKYEKSYEGVIYINHNEKEIYDLTNGYLDDDEQSIYFETQDNLRKQLISNLNALKIPFKEAHESIKYISFPNNYKITLDGLGGNVILFRQGKTPEVMPLSSIDLRKLNTFFKKGK